MSDAHLVEDLVDAALVSSAIDVSGAAGIADDGHSHETTCLNCGAALAGAFCHACGQAAHVHRTLGAFFHDLLHGVFHFEGRIWHTLPLLCFRPGALTRRYIDGQRTRFVSPLALFLFSAFVMFAAIQQTAHDRAMTLTGADGKPVHGASAISDKLAQLATQRSALNARHGNTDDIDVQIASLRVAASALHDENRPTDALPKRITGIAQIDGGLAKVRENPALMFYKVESHAYKYSWLLIPISVPFVWLLFPFSRRYALYDHTVFVTYSLCFMTLLSVAVIVTGALGWDAAGLLLVCVPPLHMYRQLRGAYACSRAGALLRTCALLMIATIALLIFTIIIVAESADVPLIQISA